MSGMNDYFSMMNFGRQPAPATGPTNPLVRQIMMNSAAGGSPVAAQNMNGFRLPTYTAPAPAATGFTPPTVLERPAFSDANFSAVNGLDYNGGLGGGLAPEGGGFLDGLGDFFKGAVGTTENPGWGKLAVGTAAALGNAYMGMKQYGLAKDSFKEGKRQFNMNWDAQKGMVNSSLADRQRTRQQNDPSVMSPEEYVAKYGVK